MPLIDVRHAIPDDAEALAEVNVRSIRDICGASGDFTAEELDAWVSNKTPTDFLKWMSNEDMRLYTGLVDDVIRGVGLFELEGRITLLYVAPEALGKGLGKALLAMMEDEARYWELPMVRLESTAYAKAFYVSQGYREVGPSVRGHGAVKMEKSL